MPTAGTRPSSDALWAFILCLPFIALNAIVATRFEPLYSLLKGSVYTSSPIDSFVFIAVMLLMPVALFFALRPLLIKGNDGKRKFYPLNALLAIIVFLGMVFIWGGLSQDVISCDFLLIPNCD